MKKIKIGFFGLSHLGLNYSLASTLKGYNLVCYDENKNKIENLKKNKILINEPGLNKLIKKKNKYILFSNKLNDLKKCKIIFISYDTETNDLGEPNIKKLNQKIKILLKNINKKTILILLSQVPPGFTCKIKWPKNLLYYQVETLIFGKSIKRALSPERFIIGKNNINKKIDKYYLDYLKKFKCPIFEMDYLSAELTKISINMFLASTLTMTSVLSKICENIGASWKSIIPALKLDKRIGKYAYLKPGLGISGGNIERDITVIKKMFKNKMESTINFFNFIKSVNEISKIRKDWVYDNLKKFKYINNKKKIGILGLSYKENTNSIKNSPSIELIKKLKNDHLKIYDPSLNLNFENKKHISCKKIKETIKNIDCLCIMTPWKQFNKIKTKELKKLMRGKLIIDPFCVLNKNEIEKHKLKYLSMGEFFE
ncbi:nucleotide sugar dehydrogenase [Candidatus Pelagibacter sp.]|uniref:nucleotide sugar dehydrogenase n=1 Tax=Candidatus Pelagibacter sp. TaxID=2024849 RepID=UPI003D0E73E1